MSANSSDLLRPELDSPEQLPAVEAVPVEARALPASTWALLRRRAGLTPDRPAITFLPDGEHYREGVTLTFAEFAARVCRYANTLAGLGIRTGEAITLLSANCGQLHSALLATQAVGIAAPVNPWLSPERIQALVAATGSRVLVAAGPELSPQIWDTAMTLAQRGHVDAILALQPDRPEDQRGNPHPELPDIPGVRVAYLEDLAVGAQDDALLRPEPSRTTWRRISTPGAPPAPPSWPHTPTAMRSTSPGPWRPHAF